MENNKFIYKPSKKVTSFIGLDEVLGCSAHPFVKIKREFISKIGEGRSRQFILKNLTNEKIPAEAIDWVVPASGHLLRVNTNCENPYMILNKKIISLEEMMEFLQGINKEWVVVSKATAQLLWQIGFQKTLIAKSPVFSEEIKNLDLSYKALSRFMVGITGLKKFRPYNY